MSRSLRDFLVDLAADPECLSRFAADPGSALDRAGLTAEEKAAVLSRDSDRLRGALGASAADHLTHVLSRKKKGAKKRPALKKRPGAKKRPAAKKRRKAKK
jgi:hypothetical protein